MIGSKVKEGLSKEAKYKSRRNRNFSSLTWKLRWCQIILRSRLILGIMIRLRCWNYRYRKSFVFQLTNKKSFGKNSKLSFLMTTTLFSKSSRLGLLSSKEYKSKRLVLIIQRISLQTIQRHLSFYSSYWTKKNLRNFSNRYENSSSNFHSARRFRYNCKRVKCNGIKCWTQTTNISCFIIWRFWEKSSWEMGSWLSNKLLSLSKQKVYSS